MVAGLSASLWKFSQSAARGGRSPRVQALDLDVHLVQVLQEGDDVVDVGHDRGLRLALLAKLGGELGHHLSDPREQIRPGGALEVLGVGHGVFQNLSGSNVSTCSAVIGGVLNTRSPLRRGR